MFLSLINFIKLRPYLVALFIIVCLVFWMSGTQKTNKSESAKQKNSAQQATLASVETANYTNQTVTKELTLYGRSEANSRAIIRSEVAGKIIKNNATKGEFIERNKSIVNIEKSDLPTRLKQAKASLRERELTYKAIKSLNDKGLQGRVRLAEVNTLYLLAQTKVEELQLALKRTNVVAPFSGFLQERFADLGDYLQVADPIFSLESIDPIIIRGNTTEHYINDLKLGEFVTAVLLSGEKIQGKVSFISSIADPDSSTFRVEAEFPNPQFKIFSGMSAKLTIPLYQIEAIHVSPSVLAIDEEGNLGVKIVKEGVVHFRSVSLVSTDDQGVWLSGLQDNTNIITLGQGFVKAGDQVNVVPQSAENQSEPQKNSTNEVVSDLSAEK